MSEALADRGKLGRETTNEFWCLGILRFPKVDMDSEPTYCTTPEGIIYKERMICVAKSYGSLGGTPIWLESWIWAAFLESHTPDHQRKVKEVPCRGGSQRWEDVEKRRTGKHRAQSFALSTPWWATPWLSRSDLPATSSVYPCGLCKDHHFLWMHLKMLGSSAGFRWRCLWTQVKFQGSYVWKRLLAEKHPFPATSLSIWMLTPV